jgi:hypothetical protein
MRRMKKGFLKRYSWFALPILGIVAAVTVVPGIEYQIDLPFGVGLEKRSGGTLYNSFRVHFPAHTVKYEWAPGTADDACWGPEGFSSTPGRLYFRLRSFEVAAARR